MVANTAYKVAIIVGSSRLRGNGPGISTWLSSTAQRRLEAAATADGKPIELVVVDSTTVPFPLGPVLDAAAVPAQIKEVSKYVTQPIQEWSKFVSSCSGFIFLTPEYNGGYPGALKNAVDHLFHEWQNKPAVLVSYGSQGGSRAAAQFKVILENMSMKLAEKSVEITLPGDYIFGPKRVETSSEFLSAYKAPIEQATDDLLKLIHA